jgi:hypothetical protein
VTAAHFSAGRVLGWRQAGVGDDLFGGGKTADVAKFGDADGGDEWPDAGDRLQESERWVGQEVLLNLASASEMRSLKVSTVASFCSSMCRSILCKGSPANQLRPPRPKRSLAVRWWPVLNRMK